MENILLIEDRVGLRQVYSDFLKCRGYAVREAGSAEEAKKILEEREFALILSDYMLPGQNGLEFLEYLKERDPDSHVILITAFGEIKLAVEAMRKGAFDFLEKPVDLEYLRLVISRALDHRKLLRNQSFHESRQREEGVRIIGHSSGLRQSLALAEKVAPSNTNCLLLGESGVGKELFAQYLHQRSPRTRNAMVSINCASIPHELMESELFGHERGAFTGAVVKKVGLVEVADGGTIFLDEIGELPPHLQPKLLRVIQNHEFFRVGGSRLLKSDIRVVCATNRDLKAGIREGWFREDLYYRLAVFPIEIPPLRKRMEDLAPLVTWIFEKHGHGPPDPELLSLLETYDWPGNVRELENLLERAFILSQGAPLTRRHFPEDLFKEKDLVTFNVQVKLDQSFKENLPGLETQLEKKFIELLLREEKGHRERVARRMGVSVKTLYNKLQTYGLSSVERAKPRGKG